MASDGFETRVVLTGLRYALRHVSMSFVCEEMSSRKRVFSVRAYIADGEIPKNSSTSTDDAPF